MRRMILGGLLAATLIPVAAQAQDAQLRDDRRELRDDRRDLDRDYRDGDSRRQIRADRQDLRDDRRDTREDWRDWRNRHPETYRGPAWVGPRNYRWRPVTVGYRFDPVFYDRRYWVDPYRYHLRPTYGPQRWVRYGNDVVLIDTRSGRVLDVHSSFFF